MMLAGVALMEAGVRVRLLLLGVTPGQGGEKKREEREDGQVRNR